MSADAPTPRADDAFALVGTTLQDKFRIDAVVAEGGFGVVYRAVHLALGREVAVKVLKTPEGMEGTRREEFIQQFAAEAKTIARLDHPSIVQVLDFGSADMPSGEPAAFMVLEWLTGKTLQDALNERRGRGGRTPAEALGLLRDVIEAVASAHEAGIAHRDLKPANIMLVSARRGPAVRLLDFGIAKVMAPDEVAGGGHTHTRSSQSSFSPHYASPEQLTSARTGPWTDVHALGLIVTELLTDRAPYVGQTLTALFASVLASARPTPARLGVDVGAWEPVIARALSLRPDDRWTNARALLDALDGALADARHLPLDATLPSPAEADLVATRPVHAAPEEKPSTLSPASVSKPAAGRAGQARSRLIRALAVGAALAGLGLFARALLTDHHPPAPPHAARRPAPTVVAPPVVAPVAPPVVAPAPLVPPPLPAPPALPVMTPELARSAPHAQPGDHRRHAPVAAPVVAPVASANVDAGRPAGSIPFRVE